MGITSNSYFLCGFWGVINTADVIQYLRDRGDYPELFKDPDVMTVGKVKTKDLKYNTIAEMHCLQLDLAEEQRKLPNEKHLLLGIKKSPPAIK